MEEVFKSKQQISFSGVDAAHQNGVVEWVIQTVSDVAHTMMLHAAMQAPKLIMADMWLMAMAMDYVTWIYNQIPQHDTGLTLLKL